jgi:cell envelope opacity-associated protein A
MSSKSLILGVKKGLVAAVTTGITMEAEVTPTMTGEEIMTMTAEVVVEEATEEEDTKGQKAMTQGTAAPPTIETERARETRIEEVHTTTPNLLHPPPKMMAIDQDLEATGEILPDCIFIND